MLWKYKKCYQETNEGVVDPPTECTLVTFRSNFEQDIVFNYTPCVGAPTSITLNNNETTICIQNYDPPTAPSNQWDVIFVDIC